MLGNQARHLIIEAWNKTHNAKEIAECFSVNTSTIYRIEKQMRETNSVDLRTSQRGRKAALTGEDINRIDSLIKEQPDITLQDIVYKLKLKVSIETVRKAIRKIGYTYKKKSLHAAEQERPRCTGKEKSMDKKYEWCRCK